MTDPAALLRQLAEPATDSDLLRRYTATRDGTAFAELVRRHGPVVLGACRRGVRNHHDADDAFQAVFLVLARRAGVIQRPELLGSWLYRVAVGVARNARRAAARRRIRGVQGVDVPEPVARSTAPPDDIGPVLDEELEKLPPWYREALVLCDLRGVSRAEAAATLGVPVGTVDSRLAGGRKKLAARLVRRGVTLSVGGVLVEARAVAVPDPLLTKTCEVVAVWSSGGALPQSVVNLVQGGLQVRRTLIFGLVAVVVTSVVGVGLAARPEPSAQPSSPAEPAVAAVATPEAQPEPKKAGDAPVKLGPPRLKRTADLRLSAVAVVTWSRDGGRLAVSGASAETPAPAAGGNHSLVVVAPFDSKSAPGQHPLPAQAGLVGFTADAQGVLVALRETGLVSGEHLLYGVRVTTPGPGAPPGVSAVQLGGGDQDPVAIADGAEQLTVTGPRDLRFLVRDAGRVTVWHSDPRFEARWPLGRFDGEFSTLRLTPDSRRVLVLAGQGVVEGYDAVAGKKLWATEPAARLPEVKFHPLGVGSLGQIPPATGLEPIRITG